MSILDDVKAIAETVKRHNDPDLYQRIMDLRDDIFNLKEENLSLREQVRDLEDKMARHDSLSFRSFAYQKEGDTSLFCQRCYDVDGKLVRLITRTSTRGSHHCTACDSWYGEGDTPGA